MADDQGRMLRNFLDSFNIPYPVLIADRKLYEDYGRTPIAPITLLVDRQGTIARVFWGATHGPDFETAVRPYLDGRAAGTPAPGAGPGPADAASPAPERAAAPSPPRPRSARSA